MPGKPAQPKPPKWLSEKPLDSIQKLVNRKCLEYLKDLAINGDSLESATQQLPDFFHYLRDYDPKFCEIEERHINTKYKFVETIR